jgi:hypothetical protein
VRNLADAAARDEYPDMPMLRRDLLPVSVVADATKTTH